MKSKNAFIWFCRGCGWKLWIVVKLFLLVYCEVDVLCMNFWKLHFLKVVKWYALLNGLMVDIKVLWIFIKSKTWYSLYGNVIVCISKQWSVRRMT